MNIDTMLRESLHTRADQAPSNAGLLDAVRDRSQRRRWRRQVLVAAGVVTAVAVAGPILVVRATGTDPAPPDDRTGAWQPSAETELVEPSDLDVPDFPFTPGWVPPGTETFSDFQDFGLVSISQRDPDGASVLWAEVNLEDPDHALRAIDKLRLQFEGYDGTADDQAVTVHGRDAVLTTMTEPGTADEDEPQSGSTLAAVTWLHEPGLRVAVFGQDGADVLRYAQELTEEPFPARFPFTFDLMPPGAELAWSQPGAMMFGPAVHPPGNEINAVEVALLRGGPGMAIYCPLVNQDPSAETCELPRAPVQVGERDAELVGDDMVILYLDDGLALSVAAAGSLALSDDDLLRFAGGIQVTEYATPSG
jgi:hypothetical protein